MTKCFLDSNVLVYLKNEDSDEHDKAEIMLHSLISQEIPLFISPLCLDEFIHVIRLKLAKDNEKSVFPKLYQILSETLEIPNLSLVNPPSETKNQLSIISFMETFSLRPRDAYHLLTMQTSEIDGFATFDHDFDKVFKSKLLFKA